MTELTLSDIRSITNVTRRTTHLDEDVLLRPYISQDGEELIIWATDDEIGVTGKLSRTQSKVTTEHTGKYETIRLKRNTVELLHNDLSTLKEVSNVRKDEYTSDEALNQLLQSSSESSFEELDDPSEDMQDMDLQLPIVEVDANSSVRQEDSTDQSQQTQDREVTEGDDRVSSGTAQNPFDTVSTRSISRGSSSEGENVVSERDGDVSTRGIGSESTDHSEQDDGDSGADSQSVIEKTEVNIESVNISTTDSDGESDSSGSEDSGDGSDDEVEVVAEEGSEDLVSSDVRSKLDELLDTLTVENSNVRVDSTSNGENESEIVSESRSTELGRDSDSDRSLKEQSQSVESMNEHQHDSGTETRSESDTEPESTDVDDGNQLESDSTDTKYDVNKSYDSPIPETDMDSMETDVSESDDESGTHASEIDADAETTVQSTVEDELASSEDSSDTEDELRDIVGDSDVEGGFDTEDAPVNPFEDTIVRDTSSEESSEAHDTAEASETESFEAENPFEGEDVDEDTTDSFAGVDIEKLKSATEVPEDTSSDRTDDSAGVGMTENDSGSMEDSDSVSGTDTLSVSDDVDSERVTESVDVDEDGDTDSYLDVIVGGSEDNSDQYTSGTAPGSSEARYTYDEYPTYEDVFSGGDVEEDESVDEVGDEGTEESGVSIVSAVKRLVGVESDTRSERSQEEVTVIPDWFVDNLGVNTDLQELPAEKTPPYPFESVGLGDIREARELKTRASEGDGFARSRVSDVPRRWKRLKQVRPRLRGMWFMMTIVSTLFIYAGMLLTFQVTVDPSSTVFAYLNAENRIGDLLIGDVVFITAFVLLSLVFGMIGRRTRPHVSYYIGELARWIVVGIQVIPLVFMSVVLVRPESISAPPEELVDMFWTTVVSYKQTVPDVFVAIGETYYRDMSPFGVSPVETIPVFIGVGVLLLVPYVIRYYQARVYVTILRSTDLPDAEETVWFGGGSDTDDDDDETEESFSVDDLVEWNESEITNPDIDDVQGGFDTADELFEIPDSMRIEPYDRYEEVIRYWVEEPYSFVSILKDKEQSDYRYFVMEPQLKTKEEELLIDEFKERLYSMLLFKDMGSINSGEASVSEKSAVLEEEVIKLATEYDVTERTYHKLLYYLERDFIHYGKIQPLMADENVEDISCDGDNIPVFVFHQHYNDVMSNISFEKRTLRQFIIQLAQRSGEHISSARPIVDAALPTGDRINMTLGDDVTTRGSTFTIRIFQKTPFTPVHLIETNTFSVEQMAYLWQAIQYDKSLIFAGGTASGKTTSMNAVSLFIPPKSKIVTIEDTREISLPHTNWIPGVTREGFGGIGDEDGKGSINMFKLVKSALRQRPEYMIVGEIRGEEATALFQAMSTGHTTYSTMHADSVKRAISRLTNPPINVPQDMISALDIVCIQNQVRIQDPDTGDIQNVRRNETITEVLTVNPDVKTTSPFIRDAQRDEFRANFDDSRVIDEVREEQGWSEDDLMEDLRAREMVLQYLVDNNIKDVEDVTRTIQAYMLNPQRVKQDARNETLDPEDYEDITDITFTPVDPEQRLSDGLIEDMENARDVPFNVDGATKQSWN